MMLVILENFQPALKTLIWKVYRMIIHVQFKLHQLSGLGSKLD
jgi:hypothetical protein